VARNTVVNVEQQARFIELRGKGMSFQKIAEEIGVSKPTLIKWNGDLFEEVKEAQYMEFEGLVEQYGLFRKERFEIYCKALNSALKEFQERAETGELKKVPTDKLLNMVEQLEKRLERDTSKELLYVDVRDNWRLNGEYLELG
jgi:transposase